MKDGSRDRRGSHSRVLVAIWTMELASKFGCNSEEFGLLISLEKMRSLDLEDAKETLEEVASRFTCAMFENPQAVLSGARHMLGVEACIKLFEQFKSYEGLYFFLGSYLRSRYVAMSAHISVSLSIGSPCQFSLLGMSMLLNDMVGQASDQCVSYQHQEVSSIKKLNWSIALSYTVSSRTGLAWMDHQDHLHYWKLLDEILRANYTSNQQEELELELPQIEILNERVQKKLLNEDKNVDATIVSFGKTSLSYVAVDIGFVGRGGCSLWLHVARATQGRM
ncbi:hypothetical protein Tco_0999528 [Tanacetum coccineum]